ncbi:hypothetical protein EJ05DRAFT_487365 [Pseudovirgaria hyperparasitica]|uniref:Uncharacterized protein n=1 Tax=Pseudovirgaria hyperparasitica TaxID=470096 RepID=A0A6A6W1P9_9PEZI|nr:uncharacterized protein EJ05DRAFT_487365 [Pseudovirgaria hyperparasitica]KAF2756463.1 hypothetical protein EJ05DRAFT_487365 [Pseudovirgaria hyperparasitica]
MSKLQTATHNFEKSDFIFKFRTSVESKRRKTVAGTTRKRTPELITWLKSARNLDSLSPPQNLLRHTCKCLTGTQMMASFEDIPIELKLMVFEELFENVFGDIPLSQAACEAGVQNLSAAIEFSKYSLVSQSWLSIIETMVFRKIFPDREFILQSSALSWDKFCEYFRYEHRQQALSRLSFEVYLESHGKESQIKYIQWMRDADNDHIHEQVTKLFDLIKTWDRPGSDDIELKMAVFSPQESWNCFLPRPKGLYKLRSLRYLSANTGHDVELISELPPLFRRAGKYCCGILLRRS